MLGERNLLSLKVAGNTVADLEAFRDKYIYVMSTIPLEDMPRQQTLFNHLIDELERNAVIAPKVVKAREARLDIATVAPQTGYGLRLILPFNLISRSVIAPSLTNS